MPKTTPKTTVSFDRTSAHSMDAAIAAFIADNGPWQRLIGAKGGLLRIIYQHLYTPAYRKDPDTTGLKFATRSHQDGLSVEDSADILIAHTGLSGEFGNSIEIIVSTYLRDERAASVLPLIQRIDKVLGAFDDKSQLSQSVLDGLAYATGALRQDESGAITYQESKAQSLTRMADNVERWAEVNQDLLPPSYRMAIEKQLAIYRAAVPEVLAFVEQARQFSLHAKGTQLDPASKRR